MSAKAGSSEQHRTLTRDGIAKRHGRRSMRSALLGAELDNVYGRVARFELTAHAAMTLLRQKLGEELREVRLGFSLVPRMVSGNEPLRWHAKFFSVHRPSHTIMLYRIPIQSARVLHINDEAHRQLFIGNCVYWGVCEYLERPPWEVLPGHFEHF